MVYLLVVECPKMDLKLVYELIKTGTPLPEKRLTSGPKALLVSCASS